MTRRLWRRYVLMEEFMRQRGHFDKEIEIMQQRAEADEAPYDAVARDAETGEWIRGLRDADGVVYLDQ